MRGCPQFPCTVRGMGCLIGCAFELRSLWRRHSSADCRQVRQAAAAAHRRSGHVRQLASHRHCLPGGIQLRGRHVHHHCHAVCLRGLLPGEAAWQDTHAVTAPTYLMGVFMVGSASARHGNPSVCCMPSDLFAGSCSESAPLSQQEFPRLRHNPDVADQLWTHFLAYDWGDLPSECQRPSNCCLHIDQFWNQLCGEPFCVIPGTQSSSKVTRLIDIVIYASSKPYAVINGHPLLDLPCTACTQPMLTEFAMPWGTVQ